MMTVDEILATGEYESRTHGLIQRCREACSGNGLWVCAGHFEPWDHLTTEHVAKVIERDQHRDECEGLGYCLGHPVPHVIVARYRPAMFSIHEAGGRSEVVDFRHDLPAAVDAARALAVGE